MMNNKEISKYEAAALEAITENKSMGQMLRELPSDTPKEELQKYSRAYAELRAR
jgi:hypothetical protein